MATQKIAKKTVAKKTVATKATTKAPTKPTKPVTKRPSSKAVVYPGTPVKSSTGPENTLAQLKTAAKNGIAAAKKTVRKK